MVVVCESCSTRFRIDDARIPAKGRLVRCSQCKATFVAMPGSASFEETVQEVVEEVASAGGAPVPEPATDLFDVGGEDLSDRSTRAKSDDERWEFDETPRAAAPEIQAAEAEARPVATEDWSAPHDEVSDSTGSEEAGSPNALEEVGDPAEWDLLRESVEPAARAARFVEPAPPRLVEITPEPPRQQVVAGPRIQAEERTAVRSSIRQLGRLALTVTAWCVLAALIGAGVAPLFAADTGLRSMRMDSKAFALADGEARSVKASFVENAFAGTLVVIRGELSRPHADPLLGLRVYLTGAGGARLGEGSWAGVARPADDLRVLAPERLHREIEASAASAAQGGGFVAVFELAREATDFELALEPLPLAVPSPETNSGTGEAVEPGVDPAAAATGEPTASSPPSSPHPSSG